MDNANYNSPYHTASFTNKHIGPREGDLAEMLASIGVNNLDDLVHEAIPDNIKTKKPLALPKALTEFQYTQHIQKLAAKNKLWKTYIGEGYYGTIVPPVIQRNILENPGWYTQYTPYQAEISQGRLEALLNYQTMVADLTGLPIANASLLDEATAAAEAMIMFYRLKNKRNKTNPINKFLIADSVLPATIALLQTRAAPLQISLQIEKPENFDLKDDTVFGMLLQYPNQYGGISNYTELTAAATENKIYTIVAADLLSLSLLSPPGNWGADCAVGTTQRFGVPMGYGGPHAGYFAVKEDYIRQIPGRIIGVSQDAEGKQALRMALQTREQHIRRDKATSNICTAQALLAIMAGMYAVYHGPQGIKRIAKNIHHLAAVCSAGLAELGFTLQHEHFFDTLLIDLSKHTDTSGLRVRRVAELEELNFRYFPDNNDLIGISLDQTCSYQDVQRIWQVFAEAIDKASPQLETHIKAVENNSYIPIKLKRQSQFLTHHVFNSHHSETEMLRYIKHLEEKDLSLAEAMIPLGSCTMKLNATTELLPISLPEFANLHPYVPIEQAEGYQIILKELEKYLAEITGLAATSLQPNSGANGEYTGLMCIRAYHHHRGDTHREIALIPSSAHGTNPASAVMAGMKVVVVKSDERGRIDIEDLSQKAQKHSANLAALMVTYPSTHGVFESHIKQVCEIIHQNGGQVYMDGANMNAQVGLTNPGIIGADVCHLNLHKTFAIPHGGGGPGVGPICVAKHLAPYLPTHPYLQGQSTKIPPVAAAPYGSASITLISYAYIRLLGPAGLTKATKYAILNANYIAAKLQKHYSILYTNSQNRVAHELIVDVRPYKNSVNISVEDIAKRLMDYGFHAPTMSWPVPGTMMIEPTESEPKQELDRFCQAMLQIHKEITEVENGTAHAENNLLHNAPHSIYQLTADDWPHPYSRKEAAYPLPYLLRRKFWIPVARVDNPYGDRHLHCTCPPIEAYQ